MNNMDTDVLLPALYVLYPLCSVCRCIDYHRLYQLTLDCHATLSSMNSRTKLMGRFHENGSLSNLPIWHRHAYIAPLKINKYILHALSFLDIKVWHRFETLFRGMEGHVYSPRSLSWHFMSRCRNCVEPLMDGNYTSYFPFVWFYPVFSRRHKMN